MRSQRSQIHHNRKQDGGHQGQRGGRNGELRFNGAQLQFCKVKRVLGMDGGDGCTTI